MSPSGFVKGVYKNYFNQNITHPTKRETDFAVQILSLSVITVRKAATFRLTTFLTIFAIIILLLSIIWKSIT